MSKHHWFILAAIAAVIYISQPQSNTPHTPKPKSFTGLPGPSGVGAAGH